ncbi:hypothetical protein [Vibrio splendidus]|uniref:hypothetical protein n=1 Tax=Vibrio splendidus TaxID=29497 RepID=UPI000D346A2A|nr:hypothetical protein [Vibrio splendidus]PTO57332.1 hypothetical protein CWN82_15220 [Vibrio splendidus]
MFELDGETIKLVLGIAADLMTVFGISGLFAWSFISKDMQEKNLADIGISVFVISVKLVVCFFILALIYIPAFMMHFFIILLSSVHYGAGDGIWNADKSGDYIIAYSACILLWIPVYVLSVSSVFTWSLNPFTRFFDAFTNKSST